MERLFWMGRQTLYHRSLVLHASHICIRVMLAFVVLLSIPFVPQSEARDAPRFGINRVNIAWLSQTDREEILTAMAANGVELVRLSLTAPFKKSIHAIRVADALGMAVLLEIPLVRGDFARAGAQRRPGLGRAWDVYGLSDLDPAKFREKFGAALREIDAAGIVLGAIELGNEINWAPFNGDLHVYPRGGVHTARSVEDLEDRLAFERGLNTYVLLAALVRHELNQTLYNQSTSIISAGLSDISARLADQRGIERLDAAEVVDLLQQRGIDRFIDAYGMHLYPNIHASRRERDDRIRSLLSFCAPPPDGTPCSITEWGLPEAFEECPPGKDDRLHVVLDVRALFEELIATARLTSAFYYDWDSDSPYSVWRCETLTPSGQAAVQPWRHDRALTPQQSDQR